MQENMIAHTYKHLHKNVYTPYMKHMYTTLTIEKYTTERYVQYTTDIGHSYSVWGTVRHRLFKVVPTKEREHTKKNKMNEIDKIEKLMK